ncbi:amidohydrolase family protein [Candidatus Bathyarchaeota archaeon]|nr:amidohydrolase family protein [Candidatus Bathyarchaeota archaeon]MBS7618060.1 amidohydrolase family protein [Candidatus Bathyarchaeota archaeon]
MGDLVSHFLDIHTHIGCYRDITNVNYPYYPWCKVTVETLISYLESHDDASAVILPIYSWNSGNSGFIMPTEYVLDICEKHPGRLIPFCVVEVREIYLSERITRYVDMGCKGFGEHTSKIPVDHYCNLRLYKICGKLEIPILMHIAASGSDDYGIFDTPDLKGIEKIAEQYSNVDFIMHGPGWWRCMSEKFNLEDSYPKGLIEQPGRTVYILENYENVYGDLSAFSGYNALTRDLSFAKYFLEKFNRKLLYGTDMEWFFSPENSHLRLLEELNLSEEALENVLYKNAEKLIRG